MLFPTIEFFVFFVIVFSLAWLFQKQHAFRKVILLIASYFFYGWWDWRFTFLLFGCSITSYGAALLIEKFKPSDLSKTGSKTAAFIILLSTLVFNLGILGFFKYYTFFSTNLNNLFLFGGGRAFLPAMDIILPVGISFFTFQALSYAVDVYRGQYKAYTNVVDVLLYVSFFPQLVAGPIVRAGDFLPQLKAPRVLERKEVSQAILLIMAGMAKKVLIANYLGAVLVDKVFLTPANFSSLELLLALYSYAIQIFCDFSAYSDIAIGVAALFGYKFEQNFNNPYRALSLQDFWRRWHISLSSWLRDYLYIPLGGNRKGRMITYRNLLLTMLLGGLWHGAKWTFVLWGLLHGAGLAVERWIEETFHLGSRLKSGFWKILGWVFTFHLVCLSWLLFRSPTMDIVFEYLAGMAKFSFDLVIVGPFLLTLIVIGMLIHFIPERWNDKILERFTFFPLEIQAVSLAGILFVLSATAMEGVAPFIYFQF